jgi:hypothetical protein
MNVEEIQGYSKLLSECSDGDLFLLILNLGQSIEKFGRMANQTDKNALEEAALKTSWEKANLAKGEFASRLGGKS